MAVDSSSDIDDADHSEDPGAVDATRDADADSDEGLGDAAPPDVDIDETSDPADADATADAEIDLPSDAMGDLDAIADDSTGEPDAVDPCAPRGPPDTSGPWIRVGTGYGEYQTVEPCQVLPIEEGLQGGHHVLVGFETGGFDAGTDLYIFEFDLTLDGDVIAAIGPRNDFIGTYWDEDAGAYLYHSDTVVFLEDLDLEALVGETVTLSVRLWRDGDDILSDSVAIVLGAIV